MRSKENLGHFLSYFHSQVSLLFPDPLRTHNPKFKTTNLSHIQSFRQGQVFLHLFDKIFGLLFTCGMSIAVVYVTGFHDYDSLYPFFL